MYMYFLVNFRKALINEKKPKQSKPQNIKK